MSKETWLMLLNNMYRTLILNNRTYAAFNEKEVLPLVKHFFDKNVKEIFDPMSGYGTLVQYCEKFEIGTYCVELNTPSYLWQVLNNPQYSDIFISAIKQISENKRNWIVPKVRSEVSDEWYTDLGKEIILSLYRENENVFEHLVDKTLVETMSLALLLPFVSRLSCSLNGDVAHIKKGGLCVYYNYVDNYDHYLNDLICDRLKKIKVNHNKNVIHQMVLGDCSKVQLPIKRFSSMITSPPYPNSRDYAKMFAPENYILDWLNDEGIIKMTSPESVTIGSNVVSGRITGDVVSKSANEFINKIRDYKGTKKAMSDNKSYYVPYFKNYFADLENAYCKLVPALSSQFEGFIIVTNNTARKYIIPVEKSVIEIWEHLGFKAEVFDSIEKSHMGAKNPDAKGFKARHMEYIIRVWRNET